MSAESESTAARIASAVRHALRDMSEVNVSWLETRLNGWTLSREALRFLWSLVHRLRPELIVEFGSGVSTTCLARASHEADLACRILSIDHDPEYHSATLQDVDTSGPAAVEIKLAPLVARIPCERFMPMYHMPPDLLRTARGADLVLIDGPPESLGGREGTLYQVMDFARPGTLVLLDDADRPAEREAIDRWRDNFGDAIEVELLAGFPKGLAAITIVRPVPQSKLWNHRLRLSLSEIAGIAPPEERLVIVDDGHWALTPDDVSHPMARLNEVNGVDQGPPAHEAEAVDRVRRARREGARFIVFGWPAFWYLETYPALRDLLDRHGKRVLRNERIVVYDLHDLPSP